ncbi:MAG: RNA polymerase sigma factor [Lachnospiraceae bacterium]|nr:RNA polymerase sigma factor [Lachnospiraceae bacterium]
MGTKGNKTKIDENLFKRIADGDNEAFSQLYYETYKKLYAFLLSLTKNKEDAEDLLQNTFIRIRNAAHLYKSNGTPMAWMCTIAKNQYLDFVRKYGKYQGVDFELIENTIPCSMVSNVENRMILEQAFKYVGDEERTIVIMHLVNGMKHREISDILGIPLSTVLSKYNRTLKKMKNYIEG